MIVLEFNIFQKEIIKLIGNKNTITNIYRIQVYVSIMFRYFCIGFIDFMLKGQSLFEYANSFSPNDYGMIMEFKRWKKLYCVTCGKYRKFEKHKISYFLEKTLVLSIICSKCNNEDEKIFKGEESIEILKILGLIENL